MASGAGSGRAIKTTAQRNQELPKNKSLVKAMLDDDAQARLVPPGAVLDFGGSTAPTGFLICDGSAVSRTTYADLFAAIASNHGSGNGTTTFNIPDYRGRVTRMTDGSAGTDPDKLTRTAMNSGGNTGNNVGSIQADDMASHNHTANSHTHAISDPAHHHALYSGNGASGGFSCTPIAGQAVGVAGFVAAGPQGTLGYYNNLADGGTQAVQDSSTGITGTQPTTQTNNAAGNTETRMKNAYTNKIIKY